MLVEDNEGYTERLKLQDLVGNEHAKRAIEVALSGNHSVVFIETIDSQADKLLEATENLAAAIGIDFNGSIVSFCKCKAYGNPKHECNCSVASIAKHLKSIAKIVKDADMLIETTAPMDYETTNRNELDENLIKRIGSVYIPKTNPIPKDSEFLLEHALKTLTIDKDKVIRMANTISHMEKSDMIHAPHMCEAIGYQSNFISRTVEDYI
jgi:predicted ATPase with chaperone activity